MRQMELRIWELTAHQIWQELDGKVQGQQPADEDLLWPEIGEADEYAERYDERSGCQLFVLNGTSPYPYSVRALVPGEGPLSPQEKAYCLLSVRYKLLLQNAERQSQEQDDWLKGLRSLTSSLDLNELLLNIMKNALKAIPAVDRGFLMLYEKETEMLVSKASIGLGPSIQHFKVKTGEGITGKVFEEWTGRIYEPEQSAEAISNLTPDNYESLMYAMNLNMPVDGRPITMAVPVGMNKERMGVMIVHQITQRRKPTEHDLRRLQGFADQAAIAITNARMYTELRETNRYLMKRSEIHEVFTRHSLDHKGIPAIIRTVERMAGLSCAFVDMARGEWIPAGSAAASISEQRLQELFERQTKPQTVETVMKGIVIPYCLFPVFNGEILVGCFAVKLSRPLEAIDIVVLEQASSVVVLDMMQSYSVTEMVYKKSYEFFNELIAYREPYALQVKAKEFGLSPGKPVFAAILQLGESGLAASRQEARLRRLIELLRKVIGPKESLLFASPDKVTMLVHITGADKQQELLDKLKAAIRENGGNAALYGGVGGVYKGLEHVSRSAEEAGKSLSFLMSRGRTGLMRYEDIGINRLFLNQPPEDIQRYVDEVLEPLRTEKAQQSDLEETLRAYIAANKSVSQTADKLHIHVNTLYHRLRRVEEAIAVNLNDPDDWMKVYLACHLSGAY